MAIDGEFLATLKRRFEADTALHGSIRWEAVEERLRKNAKAAKALFAMESTGGEPALTGFDERTDEYLFCDCSPETPTGRRSVCYDREALESRKENRPANSAVDMAKEIGIELLNEEQYRDLQATRELDKKTSSWIETPEPIRKRGGALFCDRRYDHVFTYHNGADSYYAARGFRGIVRI